MYSLTSIPTLCYDLVRSPFGAAWGDLLERALRLGPEQLADLEFGWMVRQQDESAVAERSRVWDDVGALALHARRLSSVMPEVRGALTGPELPATGLDSVLQTLTTTPLGGLSDLIAMLRGDIFDWAWTTSDGVEQLRWPGAVEIVCDALAAAYLGDALGASASRVLSGPWWNWLRASSPVDPALGPMLPGDDVFGPAGPQLRAVVERASRLDTADLEALQQTCDAARLNGFSWPLDMHAAARAAVETGRVRVVAIAQLAAARALQLSGATSRTELGVATALSGALPALTAAIAALGVAGSLDTETYARLLAPWHVAIS